MKLIKIRWKTNSIQEGTKDVKTLRQIGTLSHWRKMDRIRLRTVQSRKTSSKVLLRHTKTIKNRYPHCPPEYITNDKWRLRHHQTWYVTMCIWYLTIVRAGENHLASENGNATGTRRKPPMSKIWPHPKFINSGDVGKTEESGGVLRVRIPPLPQCTGQMT